MKINLWILYEINVYCSLHKMLKGIDCPALRKYIKCVTRPRRVIIASIGTCTVRSLTLSGYLGNSNGSSSLYCSLMKLRKLAYLGFHFRVSLTLVVSYLFPSTPEPPNSEGPYINDIRTEGSKVRESWEVAWILYAD